MDPTSKFVERVDATVLNSCLNYLKTYKALHTFIVERVHIVWQDAADWVKKTVDNRLLMLTNTTLGKFIFQTVCHFIIDFLIDIHGFSCIYTTLFFDIIIWIHFKNLKNLYIFF